MDLNLDVSMGLTDSDADAEGVTDDEGVVPRLHLQLPTRYRPPVRTYTQTKLCSASLYASVRLIPMPI